MCCSCVPPPVCHLESSARMSRAVGVHGGKRSTCPTCFGKDGRKNIFPCYKHGRSGIVQPGTFKKVIWFSWPTRNFREDSGHGKSSRSLSEPRWIGALGPSEDHHERIETSSFKTLPPRDGQLILCIYTRTELWIISVALQSDK